MTTPVPTLILIVDDEESIRKQLRKFFEREGHEVYAAGNAEQALAMLRRHRVDLMLLDIRLPDASGIELVPQMLEVDPDVAILMMSAVNDATSAAMCMQRGAMDYLTKPIELTDLSRAVQKGLSRRSMMLENRRLSQWLKEEVAMRSAEVRREREKLERLSVATLEALVNALEAKDPYSRGHSARVADLAATIADSLHLNEEDVERIRTAGRLHDLGKIGIREEVLNQHRELTEEEYRHVKQHVLIGVQILQPLEPLKPVAELVRNHHERWDGSGYPDGIAGEQIPVGARILAAAEVYDALTSARPYQEKMGPEEAVLRMRAMAGTVLDPDVVEALQTVVQSRQTLVFIDETS